MFLTKFFNHLKSQKINNILIAGFYYIIFCFCLIPTDPESTLRFDIYGMLFISATAVFVLRKRFLKFVKYSPIVICIFSIFLAQTLLLTPSLMAVGKLATYAAFIVSVILFILAKPDFIKKLFWCFVPLNISLHFLQLVIDDYGRTLGLFEEPAHNTIPLFLTYLYLIITKRGCLHSYYWFLILGGILSFLTSSVSVTGLFYFCILGMVAIIFSEKRYILFKPSFIFMLIFSTVISGVVFFDKNYRVDEQMVKYNQGVEIDFANSRLQNIVRGSDGSANERIKTSILMFKNIINDKKYFGTGLGNFNSYLSDKMIEEYSNLKNLHTTYSVYFVTFGVIWAVFMLFIFVVFYKAKFMLFVPFFVFGGTYGGAFSPAVLLITTLVLFCAFTYSSQYPASKSTDF